MGLVWNSKQKQIINAVFKEKQKNIFVEGGIGAGKSLAVLYTIDVICRKTPGMFFLIGRKTYEDIKTDTHVILKSNPGILDGSKGEWKDGSREFHYFNGSRLIFKHYDKAEALLGATFGGIYLEQAEQISKNDYLTLLGRLRQWGGNNLITTKYKENYKEFIEKNQLLEPQNYLFLTANPKPGWIKDEFIDKTPKDFKVIHLTTYDNKENLSPDYLVRLEGQSEAFKLKYLLGSWEFSSGLIYPEFEDDNIVDSEFELRLNYSKLKIYLIIDPGYAVSKFAVMLAAVLPDGKLFIFDEIVKNGKAEEEIYKIGVPEIIHLLKEKLRRYKIENYYGLIDFAANAKIGGNTSISAQFRELGINVNNARKDNEEATIYKIKAMLKAKQILVHSRCTGVIQEFGLFQWDEKRIGKVKDADNDCLDCLRYLVNDFPSPLTYQTVVTQTPALLTHLYIKDMYDNHQINKNTNPSENLNVIERDNLTYGL